jgi:hypothetical protein
MWGRFCGSAAPAARFPARLIPTRTIPAFNPLVSSFYPQPREFTCQSSGWRVETTPKPAFIKTAGDVVCTVLYTPSHTGERSRAETLCYNLAAQKGYTIRQVE